LLISEVYLDCFRIKYTENGVWGFQKKVCVAQEPEK